MENLQEILDRHAAALVQDQDKSDALLETYGDAFPRLGTLFTIAKRLKQVFIPQPAPADFVVLLRNDLQAFDEQPFLEPVQPRRPLNGWVVVGSLAGTIAGVVGLIVWLRRRPKLTPDVSTA